MLIALIALQIVTLLAVILLALRRSSTPPQAPPDPRLVQLLAADLPTQFTRLDARSESLDQHLRRESSALRSEVLQNISALGETLRTTLDAFSNRSAAQANETRETMHARLNELGAAQAAHQERLHTTLQTRLDALNQSNAAKLEEMRLTVDEKLHATLQTRLTESFGQVTDQLTKVHAGLGEMTKLSAGVDDLSRIFTNVKLRGGVGERVVLEMLLQDRLAPSQYIRNAKVKPNTQECVEFAVKVPIPDGEMLLPIDSKFPLDKFEALQTAQETGADVVSAGKAFEAAIRLESKKICEKYIAPPATTPFAILFLPTESLYAEVIRRDGLQSDMQRTYHVTIAGPSTLSALLTSFQMGFQMLQLQQKGDEVWKILASAQKQFGNLGVLMTKMENQVNTVQNTVQEVGKRTRIIHKQLNDAHIETATANLVSAGPQGTFDGLLPMLAASDDE